VSASDPSIGELPFADELLGLAREDLEASRALLQRLNSTSDALFASMLTIAGVFVGLAFANHRWEVALVAAILILGLAYLDGSNWVHFRRVSTRVRELESLLHAYVTVFRETGTVRKAAVRDLRRQVDRYRYGIESTFKSPRWDEIWKLNRRRVKWQLFAGVAALLLVCAVILVVWG
jgi:hypothetical protein